MSFLRKENLDKNILIIGDPHISGKQPISRKDDVIELQFQKLLECVSIANKNNSDIFFVGDIVDYPYVSYSIFSRIASVLSKLLRTSYFIFGNHDLFVHNIDSKLNTATGSLEASRVIFPISKWNEENPKYKFDFINWGENLTKTDNLFFISHIPIVSKIMIIKNPWLYHSQKNNENKFLILEDLLNYKLIICGDWHKRYIVKKKNTILINPGALVRRVANNDERKTFPSVILINLNNLEFKEIPLTTKENVFNIAHLTTNKSIKEVKSQSQDFIEKLKNRRGVFKGGSFKNKIISLINSNSINKEQKLLLEEIIEKSFGDKFKRNYEVINEKVNTGNRITKKRIGTN